MSSDWYNDPPESPEPPDWYAMIEEALEESNIPESVAEAIRKILDDWCHQPDYPEDYTPPEPQENTCRACGKPTGCIYCSQECCPPCVHGNKPGDCDACDHLGDLAYDAWRETR
jgi:hypothetical protein